MKNYFPLFFNNKSPALIVFCCSFILSFPVFIYLSLNYYISHSELWAIASARLLGETSGEALVLYYKLIFYSFLKIFYGFELGNIHHIKFSRLFFGFLASLNLSLFITNIFWLTKSFRSSFLYLFFLMTAQIYICHVFRVRADVVSTFFILLLYTRINYNYLHNSQGRLFKPLDFFLFIFAFLSTPKSIFLLTAVIVYSLFLNIKNQSRTELLLSLLIHLFFPVGIILTTFSLLNSAQILLANPYSLALQYQINTMSDFFSSGNWSHILLSLKINFMHYVFIIWGLLIYLWRPQSEKNHFKDTQVILTLLALLMTLIQTEKWPYFLASMLPFMGLPLIFFLDRYKKPFQSIIFSLVIIITPLLMTIPQTLFPHNREQLKAISELEKLFKLLPEGNYFDSVGILPRYPSGLWFLGPSDPQSRAYTLEHLKNNSPDFIFYTTKVNLGAPEIISFLYENYFQKQGDIWILNKHKDLFKDVPNIDLINIEPLFIYDFLPATRF